MDVPLDEVVSQLARQPLLFQPGTQWSYSSPGIEILSRIIEVVSRQKYEEFVTDRLLRPLGMKDSFFYPPAEKSGAHSDGVYAQGWQAGSCSRHDPGWRPAKHRQGSVFSAPGWGMYSTAEDLLHLYWMMLYDGIYEGHRYLSPSLCT